MKPLGIMLVVATTVSSCVLSGNTVARGSRVPGDAGTSHPAMVVSPGAGWTPSGLEGTTPAPGTCHYRTSHGYDIPDPACTPGAIDARVIQSGIVRTICRPGGYTRSVRPPLSLTGPAKAASAAAYSDPNPASRTELDHLVPLSLGGSSDRANLWAEPDQGSPAAFSPTDPFGINAKDGVEDVLHRAVCDGTVRLARAQSAIASDWTTALTQLGLR